MSHSATIISTADWLGTNQWFLINGGRIGTRNSDRDIYIVHTPLRPPQFLSKCASFLIQDLLSPLTSDIRPFCSKMARLFLKTFINRKLKIFEYFFKLYLFTGC